MLQITVKALHNLKVEKSIEDILKNINKLSNHLNAYKDAHDSLGKIPPVTYAKLNSSGSRPRGIKNKIKNVILEN